MSELESMAAMRPNGLHSSKGKKEKNQEGAEYGREYDSVFDEPTTNHL
jgi:hypothetical protein